MVDGWAEWKKKQYLAEPSAEQHNIVCRVENNFSLNEWNMSTELVASYFAKELPIIFKDIPVRQ